MPSAQTEPPRTPPPHTGRAHRRRRAPATESFPRRLRAAAARAWPALLAYAVVRCLGVAAVALRAGDDDPDLGLLLTGRYDAVYYTHIAEHGYAAPMTDSCTVQGPLCKYAFFPLYPALIRGGSALLPLPAAHVAWGIAVVAALLAAWGVHAVVERVAGRRAAVVATVLWGVAPHAMVESMAYTEPLFTALCAWSLYAALRHRWVSAGVLASLAGLTRPSGSAVVAAVVLAALWALFASRRRSASASAGDGERPDRTGPLLTAVAVAPLGWFAWFGWVGYRAGDWRGYFEVQEKWGSTFDGGVFTLHRLADVFLKLPLNLNTAVGAATVVAAVVMFVICVQQRQPAVLLVYAGMLLLIAVGGAGYFHSKARFLLPAFPLLIPAARALAAARPSTMYTLLGTAAGVSTAYGVYLMLVWPHSP
ncbi:glycosyltransferase family 39 protein [Streptomyces sp. TRM76323]|uniref:Glycosyltransferase family 39 protein n=1 Tax=Streptomyces tamarix TaxID=3078565 RepID=A0ABU3QJL7_9ACTN|nr:glycosyltransferase family 39 protein [Streptomyces tamarix]MDT9682970.1 glycosyltransferase family 39 protein [Streptomyces tamarix]